MVIEVTLSIHVTDIHTSREANRANPKLNESGKKKSSSFLKSLVL